MVYVLYFTLFFVNRSATTEIYTYRHTLYLHDALPICTIRASDWTSDAMRATSVALLVCRCPIMTQSMPQSASGSYLLRISCALFSPKDRKSTRLNSSH